MSDLLLSPEDRYAKIIEARKHNDDGSELSVLNLGPTHPATHGIFQNILLMDGTHYRWRKEP
jgi:NADH-quinone oxidoreductase subunit D